MTRVVVVAIAVVAVTADARGLERVHSHVDLAAGTVTTLAKPAFPEAQLTIAEASNPLVASYDATGKVFVRTAHGHDELTLPVGKHPREWMPWSIVQPTVLVFAWREIVPGNPETYRDILRGVDLQTGAEMWRRATTGAAGVGIGDHLFVVDAGAGLELVDSRSGKVIRSFAIAGHAPNALPIEGGDTLIDTGAVLARVDSAGRIVWQAELGSVSSITPVAQPATRFMFAAKDRSAPVPASGAWIVIAAKRCGRIDAATGKVAWTKPSTATSLLIDGTRMLTAEVTSVTAQEASVRLIARDLATGRSIRELEIVRYHQFYDQASARVVASNGDVVEVTSEFVVLD